MVIRTYLAENNGRVDTKHAVELDKRVVFALLTVAVEEELSDSLYRQFLVFQGKHVGFGGEDLSEAKNMLGKSGG